MEKPSSRMAGFDLARAYAIFGMLIVNFNVVFGDPNDHSGLASFMHLFNGNSSTLFIMLAGMGVAFLTNRAQHNPAERNALRKKIRMRAVFLLVAGLLLFLWWPADILHFYAIYMEVATLVLFIPARYYLWLSGLAVVVFHVLLLVIPFETGWNFATYAYTDFWTVPGFLRNTFYNGWNAAFPWLAFFFVGMWLGRQNWNDHRFRNRLSVLAVISFVLVEALQFLGARQVFAPSVNDYLIADYLPPFLPFQLSTIAFGVLVLIVCMEIAERFKTARWVGVLSATGQMTLTHYVSHTTLGMIVLAVLSGSWWEQVSERAAPIASAWILLFSIAYFTLSVGFSQWWSRSFPHGPLEALMRKISG